MLGLCRSGNRFIFGRLSGMEKHGFKLDRLSLCITLSHKAAEHRVHWTRLCVSAKNVAKRPSYLPSGVACVTRRASNANRFVLYLLN